ncbi:MAG: phosphoribosylanthranilate isomerase [Kofleriaceae bacterium]
MVQLKVCGVTRADDAARVAAAGVELIGLNFWPRSRRYLALERAPEIAAAVRAAGPARLVGVFVDATLSEIAAAHAAVSLDAIQLHGDETPDDASAIAAALARPVWKAIPARDGVDLEALDGWPVDAILLDTPTPGRGGSGATFDWSIARGARDRHPTRRFVLAGGLHPGNVRDAIDAVQPWAVDVASGIESAPGVKDPDKLAAFVAAARGG